MRAITPATIELADGKPRQFLLLLSGTKRLADQFGVKAFTEIFTSFDAFAVAPAVLFEALRDKDGMTPEALADLIPADPVWIGKALAAVMNVSIPEDRPTEASPAPQ